MSLRKITIALLLTTVIVFGVTSTVLAAPQTVSVPQITLADPEISNPLRGQYAWMTDLSVSAPSGWPVQDTYSRFTWRELEPTPDNYDFSAIEASLATAEANNGKYGFRVMPICIGCSSQREALPDDVVNDPSTWQYSEGGYTYDIPDFNSPNYLSEWQKLMAALGSRFNGDDRLAYIDFGGYGNYGEQMMYPMFLNPGAQTQRHGSPTAVAAIHQATIDNFPDTFKLINPMQVSSDTGGQYADPAESDQSLIDLLAKSKTIGLRQDCLGANPATSGTFEEFNDAQVTAVAQGVAIEDQPLNRWRIAPVVSEWCSTVSPSSPDNSFTNGLNDVETYHISALSSGNFTGAPSISSYSTQEQANFITANKIAGYRYTISSVTLPETVDQGPSLTINANWINVNVAPTYYDWDISYQVRDSSDSVVASANSPLDLRTLYDGTDNGASVTDSLSIPIQSLSDGDYALFAIVRDSTGYSDPMALAIQDRQADGSYWLANFVVRNGLVSGAAGSTGNDDGESQGGSSSVLSDGGKTLASTGSDAIALVVIASLMVTISAYSLYSLFRS